LELAEWAKKFVEIGVNYLGLCCGGEPYMLRSMAEAIGRKTQASEFSPDLSKHFAYGTDSKLHPFYTSQSYRDEL
jgi:betaine-homocysteine S-methyltransferase